MTTRIKAGIVGATSITAGKLIQILSAHPCAEIAYLASDSAVGESISTVHPFLAQSEQEMAFEAIDYDRAAQSCDVVFITKPHGYFHKYARKLFDKGVKIIDLSADFRLTNPALYQKWYGFEHSGSSLLDKAVYGLSEFYRNELSSAQLIANPGCYPAGILLGLVPALKEDKLVDTTSIVVNSISGISGAGRSPGKEKLYVNVADNVRPYKIGTHQHTPEIEQELSNLAGIQAEILFVPQVGPYRNGILSNIFFSLSSGDYSTEKVYRIYREFYKESFFIRVCPPGQPPEIKNVYNTNFCDIGITVDKRTSKCVVTTAIDNIVKGASGQAIQNMNIAFGINETTGLPYGTST